MSLEFAVFVFLIWIINFFLEKSIFRPLRQIQEQIPLLLHSDANDQIENIHKHALGKLPSDIQALGRALVIERHENAHMIDAAIAKIDHRRARLEAILRDLHEGVVVCNTDHRIVLFNQSAALFFESMAVIGLHRPISTLLKKDKVEEEFKKLKQQWGETSNKSILAQFSNSTINGSNIDVRMSLIIEPNDQCSGYVLSFSLGPDIFSERSDHYTGVLSERPEFYDFSLFDLEHEIEYADRNLSSLDYVVFDTETTGLRPSQGDEIVQISGVRLVQGKLTGEEFDTLVNPGIPIPANSIRFHGITDDMVKDAPDISSAIQSFKSFVGDGILVAHNAAFDMKFLEIKQSVSGVHFQNPVLDTLVLSVILQPSHSSHTLDAMATRFRVDLRDEVRHTALGDSRATAFIFVKLIEVLEQEGIKTLRQAIHASNRIFNIRKRMDQF